MQKEAEEKAERNSTVVEFYKRCCRSAERNDDWHTLPLQVQIQFTQAVAYIHSVVYRDR